MAKSDPNAAQPVEDAPEVSQAAQDTTVAPDATQEAPAEAVFLDTEPVPAPPFNSDTVNAGDPPVEVSPADVTSFPEDDDPESHVGDEVE